ncbi:5-methyltetrahydropteroyltriglutamate--homocysteine S-methyltransferase [Stackebrandtia nassauensis]|uniref:5-methyltetrahydropteroyltriglutamate--homocysteine methyltransferase n=1 Tax=Stackebrandtia nassauensis (strain DSM 44728 / CIP 108903 / NRRL B-16338 / NBRC 102104 / LLR-40K-21) TaxID=446470 RepID=D3QAQ0_STANL|nr:5-methyltetrahydropteroyltriglutamate--homocysteine S-methyltransferase [Stackebrandtia nassauensis]ADD44696.1 5-methyltetrahydropteroyltriglutamate/homocysteine S-methyltransferase [Stackebrandtia nassauensis DSM 44728]
MNHPLSTTVLGYPRIGPNRELKRAVESYWAGNSSAEELSAAAADIRSGMLRDLTGAGLESVPSNVFSLYDHVLDAAVAVDAIPGRYRDLGLSELDTYFAMARGNADIAPLELTKWFDTNYHYLVPEIGPETRFRAVADKPLAEFREAKQQGVHTRPVLLGPVTLLLLSKSPGGGAPLDRLTDLVEVYAELLSQLASAGADWVQLDEPAFALDRDSAELSALRDAYRQLGAVPGRPKLLVTGGYGDFGDALPILLDSPVEAVALDLVSGERDLNRLAAHGGSNGTMILGGLVDGRNIWRTDLRTASATLGTLLGLADTVGVSTSSSLLHVPVDLTAETTMDPALKDRLAFAKQKLAEVTRLGRCLSHGETIGEAEALPPVADAWRDGTVRARLSALRPDSGTRTPYRQRAAAQAERLELPPLPTTTIGSFPQTTDVRATRAEYRTGKIDRAAYVSRMRAEIASVVRAQERLGLDVLVHGEPERNDMVQYFAESLRGFAATAAGWVQSYGSRCVRPPILYGDVSRPDPITVEWSTYAQSLTGKPVKGMLTGPVTILAWSFVRTDQPLADTARQVALALRDEVRDLETAGIRVIQVDEPALRELLPPRRGDHASYLEWAVSAFRLATGGVADSTQVHTHLCYSEFGEVIDAIAALDADVTSIEASRSKMEVLDDLREAGYERGVGPGVYDIHSPRVPGTDEIADSLRAALRALPAERLWVNPDCGLKTRGYPEVEASLTAMVEAARQVRGEL